MFPPPSSYYEYSVAIIISMDFLPETSKQLGPGQRTGGPCMYQREGERERERKRERQTATKARHVVYTRPFQVRWCFSPRGFVVVSADMPYMRATTLHHGRGVPCMRPPRLVPTHGLPPPWSVKPPPEAVFTHILYMCTHTEACPSPD